MDDTKLMDIGITIFQSATILSIVYIYGFLMDSLIAGDVKFKIAYLIWGKMPSYKIYDWIITKHDCRFTIEMAKSKYSDIYKNLEVSNNGEFQSAEWNKLYRKYQNRNQVYTANRDFLLCRDIFIMSLMIMIIYIVLSKGLKMMDVCSDYMIFILAELILSNIAMRSKGKRLAFNVIAEDLLNEEKG
jgi:hypothetical protein